MSLPSAKKLLLKGRRSEKTAFGSAGDFTFTMPFNGFLEGKLWGGGGGGMLDRRGGHGGYSRFKQRVAAGTVVNVRVAAQSAVSGTGRYPGACAGKASWVGATSAFSSAISVAGGGGSAGGTDGNNRGGAGGDATGPTADAGGTGDQYNSNTGGTGGGGGSQTFGGAGGEKGINAVNNRGATAGSQQTGGVRGSAQTDGGDGGEGWYGGGGGGPAGSNGGGGGGGSCKGDVMSRLIDAPSVNDPDFVSGIGAGGFGENSRGAQGRVVLIASTG